MAVLRRHPVPVCVQIIRAGDIGTDALIALRTQQIPIAVCGPIIQLIARNLGGGLKLRVGGISSDQSGPARVQPFGSARAIDLGLSGSHRDLCCAIIQNGDAILALRERPHGDTGRVDFSLGIVIAQDAIDDSAGSQLHLVAVVLQIGDADVGVWSQPDQVRVIELDFGAGSRRRLEMIASHERRIDRYGFQLPVVAALHVRIALHDTNASDAMLLVGRQIRRILRLLHLLLLNRRIGLRRILLWRRRLPRIAGRSASKLRICARFQARHRDGSDENGEKGAAEHASKHLG